QISSVPLIWASVASTWPFLSSRTVCVPAMPQPTSMLPLALTASPVGEHDEMPRFAKLIVPRTWPAVLIWAIPPASLAFIEGAFPWGEGELANFNGPMEWQRWVLTQIRDGLVTPGKAIQIAVASGHGIGKTALVCWITLWAMTTAGDTRGIITASTEAMLNTRLRAELRKWFRLFR